MKTTTTLHIPMSSPDLTDLEREAVARVLSTPNLSMGDQIEAFEAAFRRYLGAKHAIGVNSALRLCIYVFWPPALNQVILCSPRPSLLWHPPT